jgi:hypothetical protein
MGASSEEQIAIDAEIEDAINLYLKARSALRALGESHPRRMGGNDNLIGRIGEFMALRYFEQQGRKPKKVRGGHHSANPGVDLVEGGARIQVKVIIHENKRGRSTRLKAPWTELLLIELGPDYKHSRIGHLRARYHVAARKADKRLSKFPVVRRSMLVVLLNEYSVSSGEPAKHVAEPLSAQPAH